MPFGRGHDYQLSGGVSSEENKRNHHWQNRSTGFQRDEGLKEWLGTMMMNNFLNMNGNMASGSEASVLPLTMGVNRGVKRTHSQLALEDGTAENGKQNLDTEEKQNEEKKNEGKGVHDAKDKVPQNPAKTIEQMAEDIQHQLEANKGKHDKTEKPKAAAKGRQADRQTARQAGRQADRQTGKDRIL